MTRTLIAVSLIAALFTTFGLTLAVSYVVHERCTDQMAQQGNC